MSAESLILEHLRAIARAWTGLSTTCRKSKDGSAFWNSNTPASPTASTAWTSVLPGSKSVWASSRSESSNNLIPGHIEAEEITPEWAEKGANVLFHAVMETAEIVE